MNRAASRNFPSPESPVADMSALMSSVGGPRAGVYVQLLKGVAADGVAKIEVIGRSGDVIAEAPVEGNVYATDTVQDVPASAIVALDGSGKRVWEWKTAPFGPG